MKFGSCGSVEGGKDTGDRGGDNGGYETGLFTSRSGKCGKRTCYGYSKEDTCCSKYGIELWRLLLQWITDDGIAIVVG